MKVLFVSLVILSSSLCLPGTFNASWASVQFLSDPHPWLSDKFDFYSVGTSFYVSKVFKAVVTTGYGTAEPSELPAHAEGNYISDETGRLWTMQAGFSASLPNREMFFLRGTAGAACILLDYYEGTSSYSFSRETDSSWEPAFGIGLGSRFDLDFIPLLSRGEFTLSLERIGSYGLVSGEIGLGI